MSRFKFWKRDSGRTPEPEQPTRVTRFNVTPRTDIGGQDLPADPQQAAKLTALRKRRESLRHDVETAISASMDSNRWTTEAALIDQAIAEVTDDIASLPARGGDPGTSLPTVAVQIGSFQTEPAVSLELTIAGETFRLEEALDWAERGFQLARSDLSLVSGNVAALVPGSLPAEDRSALVDHLQQSLIAYATDVRDQLLEGNPSPQATLADLAAPSTEYGGWLLWGGQSPFAAELALRKRALEAERQRLEQERAVLLEEREKAIEGLPVARRRLADVEREIAQIESGG